MWDGGAAAGGLDEVEFAEFFEAADEGAAGDAGEAGEFFLGEREVDRGVVGGGGGALMGQF